MSNGESRTPPMRSDGRTVFCELWRRGTDGPIPSGLNAATGAAQVAGPDGEPRMAVPVGDALRLVNHFYRNWAGPESWSVRDGVLGVVIPAETFLECLFRPSTLDDHDGCQVGTAADWASVDAGTWVRPVESDPLLDEWVPTGDPVLDRIGVRPQEFRVEQMLSYFYERFRRHFGHEYPAVAHRDRTCARNLLAWYQPHAVDLVRFVFEVQNGMLGGEVASLSAFAKGSRWKADEAYNAYRIHARENGDAARRQRELDDIVSVWAAK